VAALLKSFVGHG